MFKYIGLQDTFNPMHIIFYYCFSIGCCPYQTKSLLNNKILTGCRMEAESPQQTQCSEDLQRTAGTAADIYSSADSPNNQIIFYMTDLQ
jgi:hypothetical protein